MLRLEKLALRGFKSFSDATEVRLERGITAVVGPNGCGKSNLGDAINWVLGEQSAKMLRGQQMVNVIFGGSEGRRPMGMAEVTLTFSGALNGDSSAAVEDGHVAVTRRLYRSGESEYLLNGTRARLKDIQELLREAKVGARTYATIEQGKIEQVLNAKPKERRALIEDAAGISGYKHKRRLAELKLEATHANLLRVHDIITEVNRQIHSLKRQAARARSYRRLRDELRAKEQLRFALEARRLDAALESCGTAEHDARAAETAGAETITALEATLADRRAALDELQQRAREVADELHQREMEIDRAEATLRAALLRDEEAAAALVRLEQETAELSTRRQELEAHIAEQQEQTAALAAELERTTAELGLVQAAQHAQLAERERARTGIDGLRTSHLEALGRMTERRNRLRAVEEALGRLHEQRRRVEHETVLARQDRERTSGEAVELDAELERRAAALERQRGAALAAEAALHTLRERLTHDLELAAEARERLRAAREHLSELSDLETRFAGFSDGVRSLLAATGSGGIRAHGVVADYIEARREVEGAAEVYLHALLPAVVVEDDAEACRAAAFLRERRAGRTSLVSRTQPAQADRARNGELPAALSGDPRVLGRLRDRLTLKPAANGAIAERIGDAVLVDSLKSALELHRAHPGADYLTLEGEVVRASGVIEAGGSAGTDRGLLAHQRRVHELGEELEQAGVRSARLCAAAEASRETAIELELELRDRRRTVESAERSLLELRLRSQRTVEEGERALRRTRVLSDESATVELQIVDHEREHAGLRGESAELERQHGAAERALAAAYAALEVVEADLRGRSDSVAELRAAQAAQQERLDARQEHGRRLGEMRDEITGRGQRVAAEIDETRERSRASRELAERTTAGRLEQLAARETLARTAGGIEDETAAARSALIAAEAERGRTQSDLTGLREASRAAEVARARAESDRRNLDELCRQELGLTAGAAAEAAGDETADSAELAAEVQAIRERIERIGPVNLTAIEEFGELEERHEFLSSQKGDLEQSAESLRETIRHINRQSRQKFAEAFETVRRNYQEAFQLLFRGGKADLQLEESDDVLECGIDILAQPPGKRLTGVHLLSGGEKSLSAIALLFAIFHYQPSPFCLLDEVDAALDDSNVERFARMVREYATDTQFILVTHNKLSMEAADLLYGVTMEEPGVSKLVSVQLS